MRLRHFEAFAPICPVCAAAARPASPLVPAHVLAGDEAEIEAGILHCEAAACRHEYPIIDGIPLIVPQLRPLLRERGIELLLRRDLAPELESLVGDAIGPDTWFDQLRQTVSTYAWDAWADQDPDEVRGEAPGAGARCLARLLALAGPAPGGLVLDLGCGAGRSTCELAAADPGALVLGVDLGLALLRVANGAAHGRVSYARREVGLVYDRRCFATAVAGAERVDFWACDALALPFRAAVVDRIAALHLLDAVADPAMLLRAAAAALKPGGELLLATPWDWSARATPAENWLGGHSQRAPHGGAAETAFRRAAGEAGLALRAEEQHFPWRTRLHARASVSYDAHLAVLERAG